MSLSNRLSELVRACFTGVWNESHEHSDALVEIAQLCRSENWPLATWNIECGLRVAGQAVESDASAADPLAAIRSVNTLASEDGSAILILQNFHRFLQSAEIVQALADQIIAGKQIRACCRLAALLDVPLLQAAQNVVPVAVTAGESVERLRNWADGRGLSADKPGIYRLGNKATKGRRKVARCDPSAN